MITMNTQQFELAMTRILRDTAATDREAVTLMARELIFHLRNGTPKKTGALRAGWWPAWRGIGRSGNPGTRLREGKKTIRKREYNIQGKFIDNRDKPGEASVEMINTTEVKNRRGRPSRYGFIQNARGSNAGFIGRAESKSVAALQQIPARVLQKLLTKYGAR